MKLDATLVEWFLLNLPLMKPPAAKGKTSQLDRSRSSHRAPGPTMSYLQTRVRASRLYEAAFILAIAELTRRLHQACEQAYDKQAADWLLPQNPANQGPTIEDDRDVLPGSGNSPNCNIYVNFTGTYPGWSTRPNGPSTFLWQGLPHTGLGFTVAGSVNGGIGTIGYQPNPQNPNGSWTMDQWTSRYIDDNGRVQSDNGKARRDIRLEIGFLYTAAGNSFSWYDNPGAATPNIIRRQNFTVSVTRGSERCEVKFHFIQTPNGFHWGPGLLP